ncbi:siderophore-interacting protein [Corynebacterium sp.]|uniref:siderophore-interacting protein n=1 Tax=Corynebacterium sp. TaxID=1720 RepID=UPI0026DCEE93|nr:siderophore-interacting protein [Corynebacterium sp.]MDO5077590.1 siderophore-interacting protein [Corynebacterium sp.]
MDLPHREPRKELCRARVVRVVDLAPQLRRITLRDALFHDIELTGADEYVGLIMPKPGQALTMPDPSILNIRAAVKHLPVSLRWYTIRELRNDAAEIDLDIVTHGTSGPGSTWAILAQEGNEVGVRFMSSCHYQHTGQQFYLADPTAAPALRSIVATLPEEEKARTHVLLNGAADELEPHFPTAGLASVTRNRDVTDFVQDLPFDPSELNYAWLCGESSLVTSMRRALVSQQVPKKRILFSGYWKRGAART